MNSRAKGKVGELEFAHYLKAVPGVEARRGQQFSGGGDSPDVVTNIKGVHWEVKRVEAGNPYNWLAQAELDADDVDVPFPQRPMPVVAHRKNKRNWIAILGMDDFIDLLKKAGYING